MPISHDNNQINLSGTETGDALRGYLNSNNLGQVDGRTMIFDRDLNIAANSNFTDENASYSFNDAHRYEPQTNCVVNFTDVVLRYDGSPKNHSFNNSYTANWTRVTYIQGVDNGRSDFFNNGTYTFNFSNVTMVSYGDNDFLHFQSNATLENIIIVNAAGGLNFEPGSRVAGEQMVINNLQLFGVSAFNMPSGGVGGSLRTDGMFWDQLTWRVQNGNRNTNYIFVSPIKPDGWIGYDATDPNNFVREFYKHSLSVTDGFAPVEGARVILYRDDLQTIIYDETTDAAGAMPLQEVLTFETINGNGNDYGNFQLRIVKFGNVLGADVRALQDGDISESFLSPVNESITTDLATALAYPVITSTEEAHNRAEAALVSNFNAESSPYTSRQGLLWNTGDLDVRIDPAAIEPFEFVPDGASTSVTTVSYTDEDESRPLGDRIVGGLEKKNKIITPSEKRAIAFHEAGHATVSWMLEHAAPLVKVTIVPRGQSLGAAWYLPEERLIVRPNQMLDEMCATLGGRAAEKVIFNEISTGALSDLEKVTKQARAMVTVYGLNDKIGNLTYYDSSGQNEYGFTKPYSEQTSELIDKEISNIIEDQYQRAIKSLEKNKDKLTELAEVLLEKEVIFKDNLEKIFGKRPFDKKENPLIEPL